ncbi:class GN sortase [Microbulbifer thermotolerans]|uniref:class GN sortase n=1 Tax=Microbulbifer thermotolerans TaxID=252514 RepID=UPI00224967F2|nr:class GN sortase [Microbulbifer thermotolerans]MCX2794354.1 class GN sortase [Microbulbifer thermotolerans]MCX2835039.1 class GN sortase [Microbulbifer thermotolerans]MCX2841694.1 class GN sortase [Microbulbifer thermotolerans]
MLRTLLSAACLLAGLWQLSGAAWLLIKAELAQVLIGRAWEQQLLAGEPARPWPWADTWPVAKLQLDGGDPLIVLHGGSGQALAFGPGMLAGSGEPGQPRTTVIAAHRDTHFGDLGKLKPGAPVRLQDSRGLWHNFRVTETRVVDSRRERLPIFAEPGLLLVTCYPFRAVNPGGPLRYVVYAEYLHGGVAWGL